MTAHELAKRLLQFPDLLVVSYDLGSEALVPTSPEIICVRPCCRYESTPSCYTETPGNRDYVPDGATVVIKL